MRRRIKLEFTKQRKDINIKEIENEYKPTDDIFDENSQLYKVLQYIIFNKLSDVEKNIILYYSETKNQYKVAKALGVSPATTNKIIKKIREEIKKYL